MEKAKIFIFHPYNYYTQGLGNIFKDLHVELAYKTKNIMKKLMRKSEKQHQHYCLMMMNKRLLHAYKSLDTKI